MIGNIKIASHVAAVSLSRISSETPPLVRKRSRTRGGFRYRKHAFSRNRQNTPKNFRAFGAILLLFFTVFWSIFRVFNRVETIVLALVFQNFRACGAFFLQNISVYKRFVHV